jgi:hypothetical protein
MPINKDLQDSAIRHQIFMSRVSTGVRNRMLALLNRSEADLVRTMNALDPDLVSTRFKAARIERMLRDIRDQQAQLKGEFKRALRAETGPIAVNEHNFTRKQLIEAAGKSFAKGFDFVSPARVQAAATARPFQSVHLKWATQGEHVDELFRRRMGLVRDEIRRGFVEGASTPELVRRIRGTRAQNFTDGILEINRRSAETMVRTAVNHTQNAARQIMFEENEDLIAGIQYVAILDGRTTAVCVCASTEIQPLGSLSKVYIRKYSGELVTIRTAAGHELVITPNHPVLTLRGWLPAHEITPQDKVACPVFDESMMIEGDKDVAMPPFASEIGDTFLDPARSTISIQRSSAEQFHGDGMVGEEKVYVVDVDASLRDRIDIGVPESIKQILLRGVHLSSFFPDASLLQDLLSTGLPADMTSQINLTLFEKSVDLGVATTDNRGDISGLMSGLEQGQDSFLDGDVAFAAPARLQEAVLDQSGCYSGRAETEGAPDRGSAFPSSITFKDIVSVGRDSGHNIPVYNFETSLGMYIADGIIVKNCRGLDGKIFPINSGPRPPQHPACRSTTVEVLKDEAGPVTGKNRDGSIRLKNPPEYESYNDWLKTQPKEFVEDVLGKQKAKLYLDGKLTLDKFTDSKGMELTLDQLRVKENAAFKAAGLTE